MRDVQTITIDDLCRDPQTGADRRIDYPLTADVQHNLDDLAWRLNMFVRELPTVFLPLVITSSYRPGHFNRQAGGSPNSHHLHGRAVDLANIGNALGSYLKENSGILERCQLWAEDPDATLKTQHLHLQTKPPRSGRRFFRP
jgi:hypothetical protein